MARFTDSKHGRKVTVEQDPGLGVLVQEAQSTESTSTWSANEDKQIGQPVLISMKAVAAADGTVNVDITKPTLLESYRIVDAWFVVRAKRTGGTPDHKIRLFKGDGTASESFTAISDQVDVDAVTVDAPTRFGTLDDAQSLLESGKSLRAQLIVAGTTTGATGNVDFHVMVVPSRA